jgi:magnesium and cobalt transporter
MSNASSSPGRSCLQSLIQLLGNSNEPQNREELLELLRDAQQRELFSGEALRMIEGALEVSEMHVREVMVPRAQMVILPYDDRPEEWLPVIIESGHSRFPVIGDDRDEVEGILLAKDLLEYFSKCEDKPAFNLRDLLRPAVYVPESKRLNVLLQDFRASRNHMAMVVNEYGGVAGLVTIEDVIEQIVGDIDDEYDTDNEVFIKPRGKGRHTVRALTPLEVFNEYFNSSFDAEEFDTIGGVLLKAFGHMPERNETITLDKFHFQVLRANSRRIVLLRVEPLDAVGETH